MYRCCIIIKNKDGNFQRELGVGFVANLAPRLRLSKKYTVSGSIIVVAIFGLYSISSAASSTIRQEINILDKTYTANNASISTNEIVRLDTGSYSGTLQYYFEAVGSATAGSSGSLRLRRVGTTTDDATFTISNFGTSVTRYRSTAFTPPAGATEYFVYADAGGSGKTVTVKSARIIITQTSDPLTATETQIEIGNNETGKSNTSASELSNPKYWKYNSANWDPSPSFYAETTYSKSSTGGAAYIQSKSATLSGNNAISVTYDSTPTSGNLLVAFVATSSSTAPTISGWTGLTTSSTGGATSRSVRILYKISNGTETTVTTNSINTLKFIAVSEYSGIDTTTPVDVENSNLTPTGTTTHTSPTISPTNNNGLVIFGSFAGSGSALTWTNHQVNSSATGVTERQEVTSGNYATQLSDKLSQSSGNVTGSADINTAGTGATAIAVFKAVNTSEPTVTVKLQQDDGTFANWTDVTSGTIVSGGTSTSASRVRTGTAFTPVDGRNYRVVSSISSSSGVTYGIYNAKIIAVGGSQTKFETQYLIANTGSFGGSTGLSDYDVRWDPSEWAGVTNTYYHEANGVSSGTGDVKIQSDPNGSPADVTNSSLTNVTETSRSSSLTMPVSATDLDTNVTGTGTLNSSRIIVAVTVSSNSIPAAPTLSSPSNTATGLSINPTFQMRTTDADNDYLKYKIEVCSTSNCSVIVRTIDQTSSQTGWTGQDQQTSTAYTGNSVITNSTMASHSYQSPILNYSTQYWWRAYAIDPGGFNSFSSASSISTFTTKDQPLATQGTRLRGGSQIRGGVNIGN